MYAYTHAPLLHRGGEFGKESLVAFLYVVNTKFMPDSEASKNLLRLNNMISIDLSSIQTTFFVIFEEHFLFFTFIYWRLFHYYELDRRGFCSELHYPESYCKLVHTTFQCLLASVNRPIPDIFCTLFAQFFDGAIFKIINLKKLHFLFHRKFVQ